MQFKYNLSDYITIGSVVVVVAVVFIILFDSFYWKCYCKTRIRKLFSPPQFKSMTILYDYLLCGLCVRVCVCDGTNQENNKTVLQWLNIPKKNMVECFRLVPLNFNFFNKHSTRYKDCNNNSGTLLEQKQSV